ncbi:receptor-like protein EIX2 [Humulus lupulus]|uniref:receptor-like protein EIX2 n=1 Tax=Humulus lupulus TaxID=3486 RepID=UPI002B4179BE|nr:receptor-like protein EIX2 [Humulus lupulus]
MDLLLQIRVLQLRHNNFSGNLPSSLQTCEQLQVFDIGDNALEGKIPLWIGQKLTNLIFLSLKSNQLSNRIPSNLCNLHAIEMLDLSMNRIFGTIPPCLDKFTSMAEKRDDYGLDTGSYIFRVDVPLGENAILPFELESLVIMWKGVYLENEKIFRSLRLIDLSSNQLTGQIPEELTHLVELIQLNLSWNNLHGAIPKEVGKLSNLQSLDLSNNKLSGEIPSSLATISFLSYLKLSNNRLSGKIPTGTQLQSFEASSYTGNLRLCGLPLPKSCFGDETLQGNPDSNRDESIVADDDKWFDMKQFHMGIGVGFVIGFVGVCANIFLIKSWRIAYFQFLNSMENWLYVTISIKLAQLKRMFSN